MPRADVRPRRSSPAADAAPASQARRANGAGAVRAARYSVGHAAARRRRRLREVHLAGGPGTAVEIRQHRSAPVALPRRGDPVRELGAKGEGIRLRELRNVSGRHGVGETRDSALRILRQPPHRPLHAWKEQEQQQPDGGGVGEKQSRRAEVRPQRTLRCAESHHCRRDHRERNAHRQRCSDVLRVEKIGDDEEVAEKRDRRRVAVCTGLEQFQAGEQEEQHDPGHPAEDRVIFHPYAEHRRRCDEQQHAAPRQRQPADEHQCAHAVQAQRQQRQPPGRAQGMRRRDDRKRQNQAGEVAGRHETDFGRERVRRGHGPSYRASAFRHSARCASPRPGAISAPGRRRP